MATANQWCRFHSACLCRPQDTPAEAGLQASRRFELKLRPLQLTLDLRLLDRLQHYRVRPPTAGDAAAASLLPSCSPDSATLPDVDDTDGADAGVGAAHEQRPPCPIAITVPLVRLHMVAPRTMAVPEFPDWTPPRGTLANLR